MKTIVQLAILSVLTFACNTDPRAKLPTTGAYGNAITKATNYTSTELLEKLKTEKNFSVVVSGKVLDYCKGEGCWLTMENNGGEPLFIEIENQRFILPHNIKGKSVVVQGIAVEAADANGKLTKKVIADGIFLFD